MLEKIEREEDFELAGEAIDELFDAQPDTEEAHQLKVLVQMVRLYSKEENRIFD